MFRLQFGCQCLFGLALGALWVWGPLGMSTCYKAQLYFKLSGPAHHPTITKNWALVGNGIRFLCGSMTWRERWIKSVVFLLWTFVKSDKYDHQKMVNGFYLSQILEILTWDTVRNVILFMLLVDKLHSCSSDHYMAYFQAFYHRGLVCAVGWV